MTDRDAHTRRSQRISRRKPKTTVTPYMMIAAMATEYIKWNILKCIELDGIAAHIVEDKFQLHRFF